MNLGHVSSALSSWGVMEWLWWVCGTQPGPAHWTRSCWVTAAHILGPGAGCQSLSMCLEAEWCGFSVAASSLQRFAESQGHCEAPFPVHTLFFFIQRGQNHCRNCSSPGSFCKHHPHSEKDVQGSIGKHWKFHRSEAIRAVIHVCYLFPINSFMFSNPFILKQVHTWHSR